MATSLLSMLLRSLSVRKESNEKRLIRLPRAMTSVLQVRYDWRLEKVLYDDRDCAG